MRRLALTILMVGMLTILVLAIQLEAFSGEEDTLTLKGDIIDNMCAKASQDNLTEFVKNHTKECALMTHCAASGFAIYADGQLHKFDETSNKKIEEFLKKSNSKLQVEVKVKKSGEEFSLVSIKSQ
jgi:hypothetical protein